MKALHLLLVLSSLAIIKPAHADLLKDLKNAAGGIVKPVTVSVPTTTNSVIEVSGVVATNIKWLLISINKDAFKEVITIPVENGQYKTNIAFRDGAGLYTVQYFQSALENRYGGSYSYLKEGKIQNTDTRDTSYLLPSQMVQSDDQRIIDLSNQLTASATNDREAIEAIHEYIMHTVTYDFASYRDGSYINKSYDAVTVMEQPVTVCAGYTNLFAALVRAYGIRVKVIHGMGKTNRGTTEAHAWNEVLLDGQWRSIDSTWDQNLQSYKYFLIDEAVFAQDHIKEKELKDY